MSQPDQSQSSTPSEGMWAPYVPPEIGEPLETLDNVPGFVLLRAAIREAVATSYGPRDAVDMVVQTTTSETTRIFSGFAAGIVGQVKRMAAGDLPAVCRIVKRPTRQGETRELELVQPVAAGADLAGIAKAQSTPIAPIGSADGAIPY